MLTIANCKDILGDSSKNITDLEIENLRDIFVVLSDFAIDSYLQKGKLKLNENQYENKEN